MVLSQFFHFVSGQAASQILPRPVPLSEAEFRWEHNQDPMAVEKLAEGIRLFAVDQRKLEDLLAAKLSL
uniref:transaldolase family protein n=1 Tax=Klebsiella pneumoniae TaxID=573 RepID=UPI000665712A|nr:transaldolase family protein [Klebsiella pneumoniae]